MLDNPNWYKQDILSLESLIAYLEKQIPSNFYCYTNCVGCPLCNYFAEKGLRGVIVGARQYSYYTVSKDRRQIEVLPDGFNYIVRGDGTETSWTYGQALGRARTLEAAQ